MERIAILRMGEFLLVTIQVDMHDRLAMTLQDDLTSMIEKTGARGVLIDISALEVVDSFIGRMIANISGMSRILDARTVVVGMQPAVAITLVELGLTLPGVQTALNVERGMQMLRRRWRRRKARMQVTKGDTLPLRSEQDIVLARQAVRKLSIELAFGLVDQTKMVTAASELARNTVTYGGGGAMHWEIRLDGAKKGLHLIFEDKGPGIPDLSLALKDGWTSGNGLGMGLSGANDSSTTSKSSPAPVRERGLQSRDGNDFHAA